MGFSLVLKGSYHYWKYVCFFQGSQNQMEVGGNHIAFHMGTAAEVHKFEPGEAFCRSWGGGRDDGVLIISRLHSSASPLPGKKKKRQLSSMSKHKAHLCFEFQAFKPFVACVSLIRRSSSGSCLSKGTEFNARPFAHAGGKRCNSTREMHRTCFALQACVVGSSM